MITWPSPLHPPRCLPCWKNGPTSLSNRVGLPEPDEGLAESADEFVAQCVRPSEVKRLLAPAAKRQRRIEKAGPSRRRHFRHAGSCQHVDLRKRAR